MTQKEALACVICSSRNYMISKRTETRSTRFEVRKYCKVCGKHTLHRETK